MRQVRMQVYDEVWKNETKNYKKVKPRIKEDGWKSEKTSWE